MNYRRIAKSVLWGIVVLTAFSGVLISNLGFDYNFENFFPKDDDETEFFKTFRHEFETDNDFIIVGLVDKNGVFNQDFMRRADSLVSILDTLPNVVEIASPTRFKDVIIDPLSGRPFERDLINWRNSNELSKDSAIIYKRGEMVGTFFSEDANALAIQVKHAEFLSKQGCDSLSFAVQEVVYNADFDETHAVGRARGQTYYVAMMQRELIVFVSISILLIILFLFVAFRSWWGIWVPITVVLLSVVWILGIMQLCGKPIDLMLMVLPTIIFVVGMSDVVHVLTKYFEELRQGKEKMEAIKISFKEIGIATFLTSLTTAVGFLTLLTSSIVPIKEFGIYTAVGVFVAFCLAYSLLPAVLILSKEPDTTRSSSATHFWNSTLHHALSFTLKNQKLLFWTFVGIFVVCIVGLSRVEVNNYILEDLKDTDALKKEFVFFEEEFAGARPFEMAVMLKNDSLSLFDREVLIEIDQLDDHLEEKYGVGALISPARIVKLANRTLKGSDSFFVIPKTQKEIDKLIKIINRQDEGKLLSLFINQDTGWARINGKTGDLGAIEFAKKDADMDAFIEQEINTDLFELRQTGTARLIDLNNRYLASDMTIGLFIAFFLIAIVVGLMFKNLKMVIVCLIPNLFPLIMIGGFMGFTGIDLKVSTSIIFTIAFGIAVDDTIHFMTKLRLQLAKGRTLLYALKRTFISTGKAIIVTSIILCGGFCTLIASDFLGTFYIGLLISMTLLFAVVADLFLLPVLLLLFFKNDQIIVPNLGPVENLEKSPAI